MFFVVFHAFGFTSLGFSRFGIALQDRRLLVLGLCAEQGVVPKFQASVMRLKRNGIP